jgi:hypothetical protein
VLFSVATMAASEIGRGRYGISHTYRQTISGTRIMSRSTVSDRDRPQGLDPAMASIEPGHFHRLHSCQSRFTNQASALAISRPALGLIR